MVCYYISGGVGALDAVAVGNRPKGKNLDLKFVIIITRLNDNDNDNNPFKVVYFTQWTIAGNIQTQDTTNI